MADIVFVTWGQQMHLDVLENIIKNLPQSLMLTDVSKIKEICDSKGINCRVGDIDCDFKNEILNSKILVACDFYNVQELKQKGILCVQTFHGIMGKRWAYWHVDVPFWDIFLVSGEYSSERLKSGSDIDGSKIFKIGSPKLDSLFDGSLDKYEILAELRLDPMRKTIFYCPTHGELSSEIQMLSFLDKLDSLNFNIIIKLHDASWLKNTYIRQSRKLKNIKIVDDYRLSPYLFIADLLISDISSAAFDFLALNRPIIFINDNKALKHWGVDLYKENSVEVDYRNVGERLNDINQLPDTILKCLSNPKKREEYRLKVKQELFEYCDGKSGKRAANILNNMLKRRLNNE